MFQQKNISIHDLCKQINQDNNWLCASQIVEKQLKKPSTSPLLVKTQQYFLLGEDAPYQTYVEAMPLAKASLQTAKELTEKLPSELQNLGVETSYVRTYPEKFRRETSYSVMTPYEFLKLIENGASSQTLFQSLQSMNPLFKPMGLQEVDLSIEAMFREKKPNFDLIGKLETGCVIITVGLLSTALTLIATDILCKTIEMGVSPAIQLKDIDNKTSR